MQAKHSLEFARAPAVWSMYPKVLASRKPALVADGAAVPRIEARLARVTIDRKHLAAYAEVCGAAAGPTLPIAYPHVLAMPLHLAMLGAEAFPVIAYRFARLRATVGGPQRWCSRTPNDDGRSVGARGSKIDLGGPPRR